MNDCLCTTNSIINIRNVIDFCVEEKQLELINDSSSLIQIEINYCFMCGRKL